MMNLKSLQAKLNGKTEEELKELLETLEYDKNKYVLIENKDKVSGQMFDFTDEYKKELVYAITAPFDNVTFSNGLDRDAYLKIDELLSDGYECVDYTENTVYSSCAAILTGKEENDIYVFIFEKGNEESEVLINCKNGEFLQGSYKSVERQSNSVKQQYDFVIKALDKLEQDYHFERPFAARLLNISLIFYFNDQYMPSNALNLKDRFFVDEIVLKTYQTVEEMIKRVPFVEGNYEHGISGELFSRDPNRVYRLVFDKKVAYHVNQTRNLITSVMKQILHLKMESIDTYRDFVRMNGNRYRCINMCLPCSILHMDAEVLDFLFEKGELEDLRMFLQNYVLERRLVNGSNQSSSEMKLRNLPNSTVRALYRKFNQNKKENGNITKEESADEEKKDDSL